MDFVKYHKIIASGEEFDHVIVLNDERLISVKNKGDLMAQLQESFMLYQSVIFNVYNLQNCVTLYANDTIELTDNCPTEIQDTAIIINTLIANILSSAKTLTDKMQALYSAIELMIESGAFEKVYLEYIFSGREKLTRTH